MSASLKNWEVLAAAGNQLDAREATAMPCCTLAIVIDRQKVSISTNASSGLALCGIDALLKDIIEHHSPGPCPACDNAAGAAKAMRQALHLYLDAQAQPLLAAKHIHH